MSDFDAIWRDSGPTLWRAVYVYAGGRTDVADDAVAEAFARAMARGSAVRDPVPYLYRVAFRVAAAELKRMQKTTELLEADEPRAADGLTGPSPDLLRALRRVSPAQRAAVYLHYQADLSVKEVARLTGMSSASVRVHLSRGRKRLAELLQEDRS